MAHLFIMPQGNSMTTTTGNTAHIPERSWGEFGEIVTGYEIPVFNEREVRAGAGILFLIGFTGYVIAWTTGFVFPLRGFAVLFLLTCSYVCSSPLGSHPRWL
jgi:hypothetical protein